MKKILVVGQTPPPFGGQAMMIKYMLDALYSDAHLYHVRMCFSFSFNDRGKFSFYKIFHLFCVIYKIWLFRFKYKTTILYYPLSSSPKIAVLRDVIIIGCTRFLFKKIIYHFHAAGISEEMPKFNSIIRKISYKILRKPDLCITSSEYNPKDGEYLGCINTHIIPLGIPDLNKKELRKEYASKPFLTIMFMGLLNSTKGECYLLDAISKLNKSGRDVRLIIAGQFETVSYKNTFFEKIQKYNLQDKVKYKGVITGQIKEETFLEADIFCFPSFFSSESFGIVLLESMMYQMPLIASNWRGIQSIIEEGKNGFLVDIKDSEQIATRIKQLYDDRTLLKNMAIESRKIFLEKYELSQYIHNLNTLFSNI